MINVIIIEDKKEYREALQSLLQGSEHINCVAAYADAESCIKEDLFSQADIMLLDIQLPGMSGIELVHFINQKYKQLLCMMCTAYQQDEKIFSALEAGAHGYLLKSAAFTEIEEAIISLYNGGSPMSTLIARKVIASFKKTPADDFALTQREEELLRLLSQGLLYKEIAAQLSISIETVRRHCFNIYKKLHVNNRTEALNKYFGKH